MPELHDLDRFEDGLPTMNPLPAPEIRRRGDRLRRRRTGLVTAGAVLAVAVAVGAPVLATSGGRSELKPQPAPRPPQSTPAHGWVNEVLDFPIESRFPRPYQRTVRPAGSTLTPTCGRWFSGELADEAVVTHTGASEDRSQRWLILFADQGGAEASMSQLRASVARCPQDGISGPPGSGISQVYGEVPVDLGVEDSFAWTQQIAHDDGLLSDLTYVQVARTGNALYVESTYTSAGGDDVVAQVQQLLTERSAEPLSLLCVYAAHPCLDPYAPAPTDGETDTGSGVNTASTDTKG